MNLQLLALIDNFECFEVYASWDTKVKHRALRKVGHFERLWNNQTPGVEILSFPEAAAQSLLTFCPDEPPIWEPGLAGGRFELSAGKGNYHVESEAERGERDDGISPHFLKVELRPRQVDALDAWSNAGYQGILAMVTGAGKTITALGAATSLQELELILIGAPTNEIVQQWVKEFQHRTSFPSPLIVAGRSEEWKEPLFRKLRLLKHGKFPQERSPLVVIGSYGELSKSPVAELIEDAGGLPEHSLLIGDEVHATGATTYQRF